MPVTRSVFTKRYTDPDHCAAAATHLTWLTCLDSSVRLPRLHGVEGVLLNLEHVPGQHATPADLPDVAATLGRLHGTAHRRELHAGRLDRPFHATTRLRIADFRTGREHVTTDIVLGSVPVALYKDANVRNVIVGATGPVMVDFDDLSLAPFGYDLAKLVVSAAMTYGHLSDGSIEATLDAYNAAVATTGGPSAACTLAQFARYAEVHHRLTSRYLHRNGYRHDWTTVRPSIFR